MLLMLAWRELMELNHFLKKSIPNSAAAADS
jgi:hypothetical protein